MHDQFAVALLPLLALSALLDLRRRRIPNWLAGGAAVLGLVALATTDPGMLWQHALVALLTLAAGIAVWSRGLLGGGDVKLLAALGLWAGPAQVGALLLATALAGGVLALGLVLARAVARSPVAMMRQRPFARHWPASAAPATAEHDGTLPYGLAIACGGGWLVHLLLA